ncbi:MAG: heavy-metal-associated domain-containing protein [Lentimicrobium sp.]
MKLLKFKTNLKCNGCIAAVKPAIENIDGLKKWEVDLTTPDRILSVETESENVAEKITSAFKKAGYEAISL